MAGARSSTDRAPWRAGVVAGAAGEPDLRRALARRAGAFVRPTTPFVALWQGQLRLPATKSKELGLAVDLDWDGEWVLGELGVLEAPAPAPSGTGAPDRAPSR